MRNTTLVLIAIVTACFLMISQNAVAEVSSDAGNGAYMLTGPVQHGNDTLGQMSMVPTPGRPTTVTSSSGTFTVESFFDVFTELRDRGGKLPSRVLLRRLH